MDCNLMTHQIINASSLDAKKLVVAEMADAQNVLKDFYSSHIISRGVLCS